MSDKTQQSAPLDAPGWFRLHAASANAHDYLEGPGDHARTLAAMSDAMGRGLPLWVHTDVTRPTFRDLPALATLLARYRTGRWRLTLRQDHDATDWARLTPRLGLAIPRVLHAAHHLKKDHLAKNQGAPGTPKVELVGMPLCLLGPYARWANDEDAATGHFHEDCSDCAARPRCPGLGETYLARFGDEELRPIQPRPSAPAPRSTP